MLLLSPPRVPAMLDARGGPRRRPRRRRYGPTSRRGGRRTLLIANVDTAFRGQRHPRPAAAARGAGTRRCRPGVAALPARPASWSSRRRCATCSPRRDGALLRAAARRAAIVGTIGGAGLTGPHELAFYRGSDDLDRRPARGRSGIDPSASRPRRRAARPGPDPARRHHLRGAAAAGRACSSAPRCASAASTATGGWPRCGWSAPTAAWPAGSPPARRCVERAPRAGRRRAASSCSAAARRRSSRCSDISVFAARRHAQPRAGRRWSRSRCRRRRCGHAAGAAPGRDRAARRGPPRAARTPPPAVVAAAPAGRRASRCSPRSRGRDARRGQHRAQVVAGVSCCSSASRRCCRGCRAGRRAGSAPAAGCPGSWPCAGSSLTAAPPPAR